MSTSARRPRSTRIVASLCLLLFAGLLLAACGGNSTPHLSMPQQPAGSQLLLQTTPNAAPAAPTPRGNANSSGSFGPELQGIPSLPAGPTAAVTSAPPAATAVGPTAPTKAPAQPGQPAQPAQPAQPPAAGGATTQTQPVQAAPQLDVRWRLVYVGADNKLWSVARDGSDARVLLAQPWGSEPSGRVINLNLSPDGSQLAYSISGGAPAVRNFILNLSNANLSRQKYNGPWAQDNRHMLVPTGNQAIVFDTWTGNEENLGEGANANWTADGNVIAVRQGNIWLLPYPASSGKPQQLTSYPASGDGSWTFYNQLQYQFTNRILFAGAPANTIGPRKNAIRLESLNIATKRVTDLAPASATDVRFLALSPSGLQMAAALQTAVGNCASAGTVLVVRADGVGQPIQISTPRSDADFFYLRGLTWSPDQWVAYSALEQSCSGNTVSTIAAEKIYLVNPATPNAPKAIASGTFPVWIAPRGLGMVEPGAVAGR